LRKEPRIYSCRDGGHLQGRENPGDAASRERIESCAGLDVLSAWLDRPITAERASDLFD
jgi:hypothetical protein